MSSVHTSVMREVVEYLRLKYHDCDNIQIGKVDISSIKISPSLPGKPEEFPVEKVFTIKGKENVR